MNILITGQLGPVSYSFSDKLIQHSKVVASSEDIDLRYIGDVQKAYTHAVGNEEFTRLFHVHSIDTVVFFVDAPRSDNPDYHAIKKLDTVLALSKKYSVEKVIVIASSYRYAEENDNVKVLLTSCYNLCQSYRDNYGLDILNLYTPTLFGKAENQSFIGKMVLQAVTKNYLTVDGPKNQMIDVLALEDLGELVTRILFDWPEEIHEIDVPGADNLALGQLGGLFENIIHVTRITYADTPMAAGPHCQSTTARTEFDWTPIVKLSDEIYALSATICREGDKRRLTLGERISQVIRSKSFMLVALELSLGYVLMELLNQLTNTSVQFKFIDFRLLFVLLIAIVHGLKPGIAASVLSSISCLTAYLSSGVEPSMILYNIERWLPFACYITLGVVVGYTKDKKDKQLSFEEEENENLRKRYAFLVELYDNALVNKDQYKRQIMGYRNSYGRIFEVARRLNTMMPDEVFKESLMALEDVLGNQTIAIYNISGKNGFARLAVCSKKIMENTKRSIHISVYEKAIAEMKKDEVWVNTNRLLGYPDYIFPVFDNGSIVSLICIQKVTFDQMAIYFENLVKILCSMIEDSLIRALGYVEKLSGEIYLDGSRVMNKESFKHLVKVREQMEQAAIAEFSMLKFDTDSDTILPLANELKRFFRDSDVFGQGQDDNLYVMLSGTSAASLGLVVDRLRQQGIFSNIV